MNTFKYGGFSNVEEEAILNRLCDLYGSDKGSEAFSKDVYWWMPHTYTKIYSLLFAPRKNDNLVIFECGLGTNNLDMQSNMGVNGKPGASLRVWKDYFVNSSIYGADIDKRILFNEDRIITGYMDQTDPQSVQAFWYNHNIFPDIIIDDGLHEPRAAITLYENSIDRLKAGGIYIIEDVTQNELKVYREYFAKTPADVMILSLSRLMDEWEDNNNLVIIFK
jgi:hypothetical protein